MDQADSTVRVEVEGVDGNFTFSLDPDGRLTNVTAADGSDLNFGYLPNNRIRISGIGTFQGQQVLFDITVDAKNLPPSKLLNRASGSGDLFLVCSIIDSFYDSLEDLIAQWLLPMLDELIVENLSLVTAQFGVPLPDDFVFPSGMDFNDNGLRSIARAMIDEKLNPVRNFCAYWQLLRLLEISTCDAVGS
ncbi:MAG: hypothetical protein ACE5EQ_09540 [Phycisphaerae bacterium]